MSHTAFLHLAKNWMHVGLKIQRAAIRWDPKSIPNSHVQDSMCWHTFDTLCSLLSSLINSYKQHHIYLFFFFFLCLVRPAAYGTHPLTCPVLTLCCQQTWVRCRVHSLWGIQDFRMCSLWTMWHLWAWIALSVWCCSDCLSLYITQCGGSKGMWLVPDPLLIRSAKQDDIYGEWNIVLPCPGS